MDHEESCNLFVDVKYAIGSGVEVYGDQKADEILKEARTPNTKQYRLELYTQAYNLLNHTKPRSLFGCSNLTILRPGDVGTTAAPV